MQACSTLGAPLVLPVCGAAMRAPENVLSREGELLAGACGGRGVGGKEREEMR